MAITFVIVLPLGAVLMRVARFKGAVWVHAAWQLMGWALMIAGLGIGVRLGKIIDYVSSPACLHSNTHTILGIIIVVLMLIQPFIGFIHHYLFRRKQIQTAATHLHIWYGRLLILLGIINGGLGLALAGNTMAGTIAYGVVAGAIGVAYLSLVGGFEWRKVKRSVEVIPSSEREESTQQTA
ncbi:integral membrane protein [Aspergillus sclerotialis]|uniref:Integral membrane protein n=1 Tax=Aspergillus sclerotialis TaxID=2070753 RepID=A0A3A3A2K8_9EURO|nr:integral membrane protein [Aspergillus sclerotialis]